MNAAVSSYPQQFLTLLEPQSRFGDKPVNFQLVCPQNGTAVLKGLILIVALLEARGSGRRSAAAAAAAAATAAAGVFLYL